MNAKTERSIMALVALMSASQIAEVRAYADLLRAIAGPSPGAVRVRRSRALHGNGLPSTRGGVGGGSLFAADPAISLPVSEISNGGDCGVSGDLPAREALQSNAPSDPFADEWIGSVWQAAYLAAFGSAVSRPTRGETSKLVAVVASKVALRDIAARDAWLRGAVVAWAATKPAKRVLFRFCDWCDDGMRATTGKPWVDARIEAEDAKEREIALHKRLRAEVDR